jgi:hypothetical protein
MRDIPAAATGTAHAAATDSPVFADAAAAAVPGGAAVLQAGHCSTPESLLKHAWIAARAYFDSRQQQQQQQHSAVLPGQQQGGESAAAVAAAAAAALKQAAAAGAAAGPSSRQITEPSRPGE